MNQDLKLSQLNKEIEREFLTPFFINIDLSMYKIISNISLIIGALATGTIFFNDFLLIGLFLFQPFTEFVVFVSANAPVHRILANAHMLFNFLGVLVFFPFIPMCERAMIKMLPDK